MFTYGNMKSNPSSQWSCLLAWGVMVEAGIQIPIISLSAGFGWEGEVNWLHLPGSSKSRGSLVWPWDREASPWSWGPNGQLKIVCAAWLHMWFLHPPLQRHPGIREPPPNIGIPMVRMHNCLAFKVQVILKCLAPQLWGPAGKVS